ncbi:MAG TPA: helix-hairpin-helix domain-containing protein [Vicinamibacterales bacterium]|jgi:mono/diheme cytochrome c family protein
MTKRVMVALVIAACSLSASVGIVAGSQQPNGEEAFLNRCSNCHGTERALVAPRTKAGWEAVIAEMVNNGAQLEAGESDAIVAFLTERHGLVNVNVAKADDLVALGLSTKDADGIVKYRTDHGPFADFASLRSVPGLDGDRLDAVKDRVAFRD